MMLERNCANVNIKTLTATTVPLNCLGVTSAKYMGTIIDAMPTPRPTTILPAIRIGIVGETHIITDPAVKSTSATMITDFLPILSARGPAIKLPKKAPSYARETTNSF
jgi:hypothetical protein